jgi:hypothetical protein
MSVSEFFLPNGQEDQAHPADRHSEFDRDRVQQQEEFVEDKKEGEGEVVQLR